MRETEFQSLKLWNAESLEQFFYNFIHIDFIYCVKIHACFDTHSRCWVKKKRQKWVRKAVACSKTPVPNFQQVNRMIGNS